MVVCCVSIFQELLLRGGIHKDLAVLPGCHLISVLLGRFCTLPLLPLHRCIHCVIFLRDYILLQILVVSLKYGSWCICPSPFGSLGRNTFIACTCIFIWRLRWCCLYVLSWWSSLMFVWWYLLDTLPDYLLQWVLLYGVFVFCGWISHTSFIYVALLYFGLSLWNIN